MKNKLLERITRFAAPPARAIALFVAICAASGAWAIDYTGDFAPWTGLTVYQWAGTKPSPANVSGGPFYQIASDGTAATETAAYGSVFSSSGVLYIPASALNSNGSGSYTAKQDWGPSTIGGLWVATDGISIYDYSVNPRTFYIGTDNKDTYLKVDGDFGINVWGGGDAVRQFRGNVKLEIAEGKTFTFNAAGIAIPGYTDTIDYSSKHVALAESGCLKMVGGGKLKTGLLEATGNVTLDYSGVASGNTFIDGNLTIDESTNFKFPSTLTEGTAYALCSGELAKGVVPDIVAKEIVVGAQSVNALLYFNGNTVSYTVPRSYSATVSGATKWSEIAWDDNLTWANLNDVSLSISGDTTITVDSNVRIAALAIANTSGSAAKLTFAKENSGSLMVGGVTSIPASTTLAIGNVAENWQGVISGDGAVEIVSGNVALSAANTFTGGLVVDSDATAETSVATGFGPADQSITLKSGSKLSVKTGVVYTKTLTVDGDVTISVAEGATFGVANKGAKIQLGTNTLTKDGDGTFTLNNVTVSGAGKLLIKDGDFKTVTAGNAASDATLQIAEGATLTVDGTGMHMKNVVIDQGATGSVAGARLMVLTKLTVNGELTINSTGRLVSGNGDTYSTPAIDGSGKIYNYSVGASSSFGSITGSVEIHHIGAGANFGPGSATGNSNYKLGDTSSLWFKPGEGKTTTQSGNVFLWSSGTGSINVQEGTLKIATTQTYANGDFGKCTINIENGGTLRTAKKETFGYNYSTAVTIEQGGVLSLGNRESFTRTLNLNGGRVEIEGEENYRAFDFYKANNTVYPSINVAADSTFQAISTESVPNPEIWIRGKNLPINVNDGATFSFNACIVDDTYSSNASATGYGIEKSGAGTLALNGYAYGGTTYGYSYSGPTIISAGKLELNAQHTAGSTYSVASGATLKIGENGSLTTALALAGGSTIEFGAAGKSITTSSALAYSGAGAVKIAFSEGVSLTAGMLISGDVTAATFEFADSAKSGNWSLSASSTGLELVQLFPESIGYLSGTSAVVTNTASAVSIPASATGVMTVMNDASLSMTLATGSAITGTTSGANQDVYVFASDANGDMINTGNISSYFTATVENGVLTIAIDDTKKDVLLAPSVSNPIGMANDAATFSIVPVPYFWYAVKSAETLGGTYKVAAGDSAIQQPTTTAALTLSATAPETVRYYKLAVAPSKAALVAEQETGE